MRWLTCCFPTYLTPKSSTHKVKDIGRHSCVQKTGVSSLCQKPSLFKRVYDQLLIQKPTLGFSVHSTANFSVNVALFCDFFGQAVFLDKIIREVAELEAHVLVAENWLVQIEILDIDGQEFFVGG